MGESRLKSLAKSFTFRILASLMTVAVLFMFTNNTSLSVGFGAVDFFGKMGLYYLHERAWVHIE
ncbi:Uncharacterised protein [uncultured archaeon]|nr:Uncharacterised protein [uncultured archaeon]